MILQESILSQATGTLLSPVVGEDTTETQSPSGYVLLETGLDKLILEDGLGFLLLEG